MAKSDLSRALSRTLRHQAKAQGFKVSPDGFVDIYEILQSPIFAKHKPTVETINELVETDAKRRYELSPDHSKIRCVNGHSMDVDVAPVPLSASDLPKVIVHGTSMQAWQAIKASGGLSRMGRLHVHMASGLFDEVISGMRKTAQVHIYINGPLAMKKGIVFLRATNGAILSTGLEGVIPLEFVDRVVRSGEQIWP